MSHEQQPDRTSPQSDANVGVVHLLQALQNEVANLANLINHFFWCLETDVKSHINPVLSGQWVPP